MTHSSIEQTLTRSFESIDVELGPRSYKIHIGNNLLANFAVLNAAIKGNQVMVISNGTVAPLYMNALKHSLNSDYQVDEVILPDGEKHKDMAHLQLIFDALLEKKHTRSTTLIALGGGVVGDMTGFAAATFQRGVGFIQIPSTLLAQVDSSVGGKTAVNHPRGKNMIGAFYQPSLVLADTQLLQTLPVRELSAGLAEVIKYGYIWDAEFLNWLEANMLGLVGGDQAMLRQAIKRSCEIKAEVVSQDETEQGIRAILNFGHTFGHAIETELGYGKWLHGEAIGLGMLLALEMSVREGKVVADEVSRLRALLVAAKLPVSLGHDIPLEKLLEHMAVDKKVIDKNLRLVLIDEIGCAVVTSNFSHANLQKTLEAVLQ